MTNNSNSTNGDDRTTTGHGDFDETAAFSTGFETSVAGSGGDGNLGLTEDVVEEDRVLQWLQALDVQVMGACRADERLKPFFKLNNPSSGSVAEDRLLAHLSQHFEASEVGMLARCFCIPLVSIRVGKINKQGSLLCPTSTRGNLNLILVPTSDLRLSFIGDDGNTEILFTLGSKLGPAVKVEEISADSSGRSFHIKIADGRDFYFWCSEKSRLLGIELISKMKDIFKKRPSIADLTGISKPRLDSLATHLGAYLFGSGARDGVVCFTASSSGAGDLHNTSSSNSSRSFRSRCIGNQAVKANSSYQGSLSPRLNSFKEGLPRSLSSLRNAAKETLKHHSDGHLLTIDNLTVALPSESDASNSNQPENDKPSEIKSCPITPSCFLDSLGKLAIPPLLSSTSHVTSTVPPLVSPYYCWCPEGASAVQFPSAFSPASSSSSTPTPLLPPLSSLLSVAMPSKLLAPTPPLSLADIPKLDFPAFLPDPLIRLPMPSTQQIPTFTPLMCDPIVHIPVIDVCSSGQGYLVSAGPAISGTIPPLHPKLLNPLIPETESMVEKGARETLRLLINSSTQGNQQLLDALPAVLTSAGEKQGLHSVGSRGLYTGSSDVSAIVNNMATIALVSLSQRSAKEVGDNLQHEPSSPSEPSNDDDEKEGNLLSDAEERTH